MPRGLVSALFLSLTFVACAAPQSLEYRVACTAAATAQRRQVPRVKSPQPDVIWEGDSDGWHVLWTESDVTAFKTPKDSPPAFFLSERLRSAFDGEERSRSCTRDVSVRLLSVVGPLLSYEEEARTTCDGTLLEGTARYVTLDLSTSPPRAVGLTDLFDERDVVAALEADPLVGTATPAGPSSFSDLTNRLVDSPPHVPPSACYRFPRDLAQRFAFHHVDRVGSGRVSLRIGLPGGGACPASTTRLEATLPIPARLNAALRAAERREAGMLMQDFDTAAGHRRMRWESAMDGSKPH